MQEAAACTRALYGRVAAAVPSRRHLLQLCPHPSLARTPCPHSAAPPVHPVMLPLSTCPRCPLPASPLSAPMQQQSLELQIHPSHPLRTFACAETPSGWAYSRENPRIAGSYKTKHSLLQANSAFALDAHACTGLICASWYVIPESGWVLAAMSHLGGKAGDLLIQSWPLPDNSPGALQLGLLGQGIVAQVYGLRILLGCIAAPCLTPQPLLQGA